MTGMLSNRGSKWALNEPQRVEAEASLHRFIQENPQLLTLACSLRLAVLGSEVQQGNSLTRESETVRRI